MRDAFTRIDKKLLKKTTTLEKLNKYSKAVYIHYIFLKPYIKHISTVYYTNTIVYTAYN